MMMAPANCDLRPRDPPGPGRVSRRGRRNSCKDWMMMLTKMLCQDWPCLDELLTALAAALLQVEGHDDDCELGDTVSLVQSPGQLQQRPHS